MSISTTNLDAGSDKPKAARDDILAAVQAVNQLLLDVPPARPVLPAINSPSILLTDGGTASMVSTNRDVIALVDTELNLYGFNFCQRLDNLAITEDCYAIVTVPTAQRDWGFGDYLAVSVFVKTSDWAGLSASRIRPLIFKRAGGALALAAMTVYDQIRADLRRYHGVYKITDATFTDISMVRIEVTGNAARSASLFATGYMAAFSEGFPLDIDWRDAPRVVSDAAARTAETAAVSANALAIVAASATAASATAAVTPVAKSVALNGQLLNAGAGAQVSLGSGAAVFAATSNADLLALGCTHVIRRATLGVTQDAYFKVTTPRKMAAGYIAASVYIEADDWSWLGAGRIRLLFYNVGVPGSSYPVTITSYVAVSSTLRRYSIECATPVGITDLNDVWIDITAPAGRTAVVSSTGYAMAISERKIGPVDWKDFDPYSTSAQEARLAVLEYNSVLPTLKSVAFNGNFNNAGYGLNWILGNPAPVIVPVTDATLVAAGCQYAGVIDTTIRYLQVAMTRPFRDGNFVAASVLVEQSAGDFSFFVTTGGFSTIRLWVRGKAGGSAQYVFTFTSFVQLSSTVRRYQLVGQIPAIVGDVLDVFFGVQAVASPVVRMTGFTVQMSETNTRGTDWADFDPWQSRDQGERIAALESVVGTLVPQTDPKLLIPSSFHLVDGAPLELYKSGLTHYREASQYDIAAKGARGARASVQFAGRMLTLDSLRLSGAGSIWAEKSGVDTSGSPLFRKPVTFYNSTATRSGSPSTLRIGDSLSYQGMAAAEKAILVAAGMTPTYVGTYQDQGATILCEAHSSWRSTTFTYKLHYVNADGSGLIYPVRTGAGTVPTFTVSFSAGAVTSITTSGGSGLDDCAAMPIIISGGGGTKAYATMVISGGVPGAVTLVSGGSGYTSTPTAALPPTVAEYLALVYSTRWQFNPFIRPATGGDSAAVIFNGYVFDFGLYLSRFSIAAPTFVDIQLSMNDVTGYTQADAVANVSEAFSVMYASIRSAAPSAKVGFMLSGRVNTAAWETMALVIEEVLRVFDRREAEGIYVLPVWAVQDDDFIYGMTVSSTNASTGVQSGSVADSVHPDADGIKLAGHLTASYKMCQA
jgi:hypothetical protein